MDNCGKKCGTETSAIFAGSNCEVKVPGSHKKKKQSKRVEKRNPDASKKSTNLKAKESTKTMGDKGAFCIDWRDIEEAENFQRDNKKSPISNACEELQGETSPRTVLNEEKNRDEKIEESVSLGKLHPEGQKCTPNGNCCAEQKIEVSSTTQQLPLASVMDSEMASVSPHKVEEEKQTHDRKAVTLSPDEKTDVFDKVVEGTSAEPSKKGKRKISSLSDEELKKRIRLKQKRKEKKKRRKTSKCYKFENTGLDI